MRERIKQVILEVAAREGIKVEEIILFGSRARGEATEHSDWDILIIVEGDFTRREIRKMWYKFYSALHKFIPGHPYDIIVQTKERFNLEKKVVNTIANEAYIDGVKL